MKIDNIFGERLSELMFQNDISSRQLSEKIGIGDSTIRCWLNGQRNTRLLKAIKVADYFNCSLEFLFGRSKELLDFKLYPALPFYEKLSSILSSKNITIYRISKEAQIPDRNFKDWRAGRDPLMQSVIDVANYLDITLDYLVGRER